MGNLINIIGLDKLTHFGWGGWICACISIMLLVWRTPGIDWSCLLYAIAGIAVACILALINELIRPPFNWRDFAWSIAGAATVVIAITIGILLNKARYGW